LKRRRRHRLRPEAVERIWRRPAVCCIALPASGQLGLADDGMLARPSFLDYLEGMPPTTAEAGGGRRSGAARAGAARRWPGVAGAGKRTCARAGHMRP